MVSKLSTITKQLGGSELRLFVRVIVRCENLAKEIRAQELHRAFDTWSDHRERANHRLEHLHLNALKDEALSTLHKTAVGRRSPQDLDVLKRYCLGMEELAARLGRCPDALLGELCNHARPLAMTDQTLLFLQGQAAHEFYVLLSGTVKLYVWTAAHNPRRPRRPSGGGDGRGGGGGGATAVEKPPLLEQLGKRAQDILGVSAKGLYTFLGKHVHSIQEGRGFGEASLISELPRNASAVCEGPCELMVVPKNVFLRATTGKETNDEMAKSSTDKHSFLMDLPLLKDWPMSRIDRLTYKLTQVEFPRNAIISRIGSPVEHFFFIYSGEVCVTQEAQIKTNKALQPTAVTKKNEKDTKMTIEISKNGRGYLVGAGALAALATEAAAAHHRHHRGREERGHSPPTPKAGTPKAGTPKAGTPKAGGATAPGAAMPDVAVAVGVALGGRRLHTEGVRCATAAGAYRCAAADLAAFFAAGPAALRRLQEHVALASKEHAKRVKKEVYRQWEVREALAAHCRARPPCSNHSMQLKPTIASGLVNSVRKPGAPTSANTSRVAARGLQAWAAAGGGGGGGGVAPLAVLSLGLGAAAAGDEGLLAAAADCDPGTGYGDADPASWGPLGVDSGIGLGTFLSCHSRGTLATAAGLRSRAVSEARLPALSKATSVVGGTKAPVPSHSMDTSRCGPNEAVSRPVPFSPVQDPRIKAIRTAPASRRGSMQSKMPLSYSNNLNITWGDVPVESLSSLQPSIISFGTVKMDEESGELKHTPLVHGSDRTPDILKVPQDCSAHTPTLEGAPGLLTFGDLPFGRGGGGGGGGARPSEVLVLPDNEEEGGGEKAPGVPMDDRLAEQQGESADGDACAVEAAAGGEGCAARPAIGGFLGLMQKAQEAKTAERINAIDRFNNKVLAKKNPPESPTASIKEALQDSTTLPDSQDLLHVNLEEPQLCASNLSTPASRQLNSASETGGEKYFGPTCSSLFKAPLHKSGSSANDLRARSAKIARDYPVSPLQILQHTTSKDKQAGNSEGGLIERPIQRLRPTTSPAAGRRPRTQSTSREAMLSRSSLLQKKAPPFSSLAEKRRPGTSQGIPPHERSLSLLHWESAQPRPGTSNGVPVGHRSGDLLFSSHGQEVNGDDGIPWSKSDRAGNGRRCNRPKTAQASLGQSSFLSHKNMRACRPYYQSPQNTAGLSSDHRQRSTSAVVSLLPDLDVSSGTAGSWLSPRPPPLLNGPSVRNQPSTRIGSLAVGGSRSMPATRRSSVSGETLLKNSRGETHDGGWGAVLFGQMKQQSPPPAPYSSASNLLGLNPSVKLNKVTYNHHESSTTGASGRKNDNTDDAALIDQTYDMPFLR